MYILRKALVSTLVLSFVFGLHTDVLNAEASNKAAVVTGRAVNFRQTPSMSAKILSVLPKGTRFVLKGSSGSWISATYNGKSGWLYSSYVSVSSSDTSSKTAVTGTATVNTEILNLRSSASASSKIAGKLKKGDTVSILSSSGVWRKVKTSKGVTGWVSSVYLTTKASGSAKNAAASPKKTTASPKKTTVKESAGTSVIGTATVTAGILNLRSSASTSSKVTGTLKKGEKVDILSRSGIWRKVKTSKGMTGWVSSEYLSTGVSSTSKQTAASPKVTTTSPKVTTTTSRGSDTQRNINKVPTSASLGDEIVAYAGKFLGAPYVWGGASPSGFDCSGFIYYVYKHFGIIMPRSSGAQGGEGILISKSELKPGDLMFFDTSGDNNGEISHVGIYIGNGQFIHASNPRTDVKITSVNDSFYSRAYVKSKRVIK